MHSWLRSNTSLSCINLAPGRGSSLQSRRQLAHPLLETDRKTYDRGAHAELCRERVVPSAAVQRSAVCGGGLQYWPGLGLHRHCNSVLLPAEPTTHLQVQAVEEGWHDGLIVIVHNEIPVSHVLKLVSIGGSQLGHVAHSRHKLQPARSYDRLRNKPTVHCQTQDGAKQAKSMCSESHLIAQVPQSAVQGALSGRVSKGGVGHQSLRSWQGLSHCSAAGSKYIWLALPHPYAVVCVVSGETLMSSTTSMLGTS